MQQDVLLVGSWGGWKIGDVGSTIDGEVAVWFRNRGEPSIIGESSIVFLAIMR